MKSILWSLIFIASLTYSTYAATTTTRPTTKGSAAAKATPTAKAGSTPKKGKTDHGIQSRIGGDNTNIGSGRVITTRLGTDGVTPQQQCRCVLFYLCDQSDVMDVPQNGEQCAAQLEVCCLLPLNSLNDTSLPPINPGIGSSNSGSGSSNSGSGSSNSGSGSTSNGSGSSNSGSGSSDSGSGSSDTGSGSSNSGSGSSDTGSGSSNSGSGSSNSGSGSSNSGTESSNSNLPTTTIPTPIITPSESSTGTTADPNGCQCVPFSRCLNTTDPVTGAGNIDVRIPTCSSNEICCNLIDIVNTSEKPTGGSGITSETSTFPQPTPSSEGTPAVSESTPTPVSDQCGVRNSAINNRITMTGSDQSKETIFAEFPWMAIILTSEDSDGERIDNLFVCGASLVAPNIILTAAHCVYQRDVSLLKIRAGEYDTRSGSRVEPLPHQDIRVSHVYIHPKYNPKVLYNDVALITTEQPFNVSRHIGSICIPLVNSEFAGDTIYDSRQCLATGWGKDAFGADARYQTTLKKVDLSLVSHDQCQKQLRGTRLGPYYVLDPSFVCAGGEQGADTCEGDGGGPLICALKSDPNRYVQVGIVSWGIGCGGSIPAVYASLQNNINWLTEQYTVLTTFQEQSFGSGTIPRHS